MGNGNGIELKNREHLGVLAKRLGILHFLGQVTLVGIAFSYFFAQIVEGPFFRELAENNRLRRLAIEAPRGVIYDRNGKLLVENIPSYQLLCDRSLSRNLDASLNFSADILAIPRAELASLLERYRKTPKFQPVLLGEALSLDQVARFGVHHLEHPEFEVVVEHQRLYRHAHQTAHILGYLSEVSTEDLKNRSTYRPGDLVGRKGIEQLYDTYLRGRHGDRIVVVDSRGRQTEEHQQIPARSGNNLRLTIDLDLQQEAADLLADKTGVIVALDPRNGEILALASNPSYNPNLFAQRLRPEEWQELITNPQKPLQNRALQNTFPPGSVFKIIVALAALENGWSPNATAFCPGYSTINGTRFRCWKQGGHGTVNLKTALMQSCNVYFHQLGQKLGIDKIATYARRFGLGRLSGIDLADEKPGLVPDTRWSLERRGTQWFGGETISVATGQGPILVTPLQLATMMSALARGRPVRPHLVRTVESPAGMLLEHPEYRDEPLPPLGIAPEHLQIVRQALWGVVNEPQGTAHSAAIPGKDIVGKTGTAQVVTQKTWTKNEQLAPEHRDHAWFASFAPLQDPQLVVVVFVEHGGGGSKAAAPLAKAIYEKFFAADHPDQPPA